MSEPTRHLPPRPEDAPRLEVEHHIAELVDRLVEQGMDEGAARREAERRFGSPERVTAKLERTGRRRRTMGRLATGWGWVAGGGARALRSALRRPGFALGVVLTLGLGVGANAAMFGILDRLLFQPPAHVRAHERVVRIMVERPFLGRPTRQASITFPDYMDMKRHGGFAAVAGFSGGGEQTLGRGADATRLSVTWVSAGFFEMLGTSPALGRFFRPEDDAIGAAPTLVLSHEYWRAAMAADPDALGRTLELGGHVYTIIGVAPPDFTGVDLARVDVWIPLETGQGLIAGTEWHDSRGWYWMRAVARLADGVDVAAAAEEATALHRAGRAEQIAKSYPADVRVALDPLIAAEGPEATPEAKVARWLGGVSLIVLLIACANVANLLLANGVRRRREVAVRLALGVERGRLVTQMVLESVLLALAGGAVALLFAAWGGRLIRATLLPDVAFPESALSARLIAFTALAALVAGVVAGLGPAVQATRADLGRDLAAGAKGSARRSRARSALTALQAALSMVLLVGAGLFVRSVGEVRRHDLGLDVDRLVLAQLEFDEASIPGSSADGPPSPEANRVRNELYRAALTRAAAVPGVESAAATDSPFGWALARPLEVPGWDSLPKLPGGGPYLNDVTPEYFATVGLRVTRGRAFTSADDEAAPHVAIVSETMARTLWPDADAVGRTLLVEAQKEPVAVVGVVEDASRGDLQGDAYMSYYMPAAQRPARRLAGLYVRARGDDAAELSATLAPVLRALDPRVRYATVGPLRERIDPQARSWTLGATMFTVFGALALVVAAIGLYSVLAFDVAQRTRELGIRSALGAEKRKLLQAVVREGITMAGVGAALGLAIALAAAPYVTDLLFEVSPRDPLVLAVVPAVLLVTAVLASLLPALRATRVDPIVALRTD